MNTLLSKAGLERHEVSAEEVQRLEPALKTDTLGGFYTQSDFTGDIHRYACALSAACEKMGVTFHYKTRVTEIHHTGSGVRLDWATTDDTAQQYFNGVVVCAGVGSRAIAAKLGDRANIYPVKGYSITVNLDDSASRTAAPWMRPRS